MAPAAINNNSQSQSSQPPAVNQALSGSPTNKVNILIVDDRADKILALESILLELNENIVCAQSGKEALKLLLQDDYAVILLDVSMPVMDGYETAELIRRRERNERTPIIFVTAINSTDSHASKGYSLGAVDYIFAPVVADVLRAKVAVFIDLFKKSAQVKYQAELLHAAAERRADQLDTRLRSLLNRIDVGVFRAELDGSIIEANPAFFRLLGLENGIATPNLASLYSPTRARNELLSPLRATGTEREPEVQMRRANGDTIWVSVTRSLHTSDDGREYIEGLIEDVSERKLAADVLVRKVEQLARSNADLEQFAYVSAHDLKEPLRMVSAYSTLIAHRYDQTLDGEGKQYLSYVLDGARHAQQLINDLLTFSRAGAEETVKSVDLEALLKRTIFNLQAAIDEKQAVILSEPLPVVDGDPVLLGQLLQNLISNAIKFCADAPPMVRISVAGDEKEWQFCVSDNGIGISPQYQERIFGMFQRLHSRKAYPGTGIGLALCRKVVERHGGRIWVESETGKGSKFLFSLQRKDASGAHVVQSGEQQPAHE